MAEVEIPGGLTRRVYTSRVLSRSNSRERRVSVAEYLGRGVVEIRDWERVPSEVGGQDDLVPSSGILVPLNELVALRKTLQQVEQDYKLSGGEQSA